MRRLITAAFFGALAACSSSSAAPDDSAAQAFVGTWSRTGTVTTACPGQSSTQTAITGTLTIALGATTGTIAGTDSTNGCTDKFAVSGKVATENAGETCTFTNTRGGQSTTHPQSHTLTLAADGKSITLASSGTVDVGLPDGGAGPTCTTSASGTFTKE